MLFLTLNTNQPNCLKSENEIIWTFPNLDLACYSYVGLSSLMASFDGSGNDQLVTITTSIIENNSLNPFGIIYVIPGKNDIIENSRIFEKWPLDSTRPRHISFQFNNPSVKIEFCQITLVFTEDENAT